MRKYPHGTGPNSPQNTRNLQTIANWQQMGLLRDRIDKRGGPYAHIINNSMMLGYRLDPDRLPR